MLKRMLLGLTIALTLGVAAQAAEEVVERLQSTSLSFSGGRNYTNAVLTVTGPNGYRREETVSRGMPIFRLQTAGRLVDGYYRYSLIAATDEDMPVSEVNNGRGPDAPKTAKKPFAMHGAFSVQKGLLQPPDTNEGSNDSN